MIRFATVGDIPQMLAIYAPYVENTTYTFEYSVPTEEEFSQRFLSYTAQFPWLVWEEAGQVLGYAYGSAPFQRAAYSWCSEVSVYLSPAAQGRGIGRQLYTLLESILWKQGYRVIYALVTSENTASLAFHQKLGYNIRAVFPHCGLKFQKWLGVTWLEKQSNFVDFPSEKPISWRFVVENDGK